MTEIISLLLTISGVCGAIVTIIGCVTLLAKNQKMDLEFNKRNRT